MLILVGMGRLVVHRSQIGDWVREVSFSRGGGEEERERSVEVRFRPVVDETGETEIVFEARFPSFNDAVAVVTSFLDVPFDRWPGPDVDGPSMCVAEPFLVALKRDAVELPDPTHFHLRTGWVWAGGARPVNDRNWVHAYLPFPSRYPWRRFPTDSR